MGAPRLRAKWSAFSSRAIAIRIDQPPDRPHWFAGQQAEGCQRFGDEMGKAKRLGERRGATAHGQRDADPAKSREHVLLSVLAERRLLAGQSAELGALMQDVLEPAISEIGVLSVNAFMKKAERRSLAAALNSLTRQRSRSR
jgi:hypothetical protein